MIGLKFPVNIKDPSPHMKTHCADVLERLHAICLEDFKIRKPEAYDQASAWAYRNNRFKNSNVLTDRSGSQTGEKPPTVHHPNEGRCESVPVVQHGGQGITAVENLRYLPLA